MSLSQPSESNPQRYGQTGQKGRGSPECRRRVVAFQAYARLILEEEYEGQPCGSDGKDCVNFSCRYRSKD